MHTFKNICFSFWLIVLCSLQAFAIPADTTYTVYQTYIKLQKKYPAITITQPVKNAAYTEVSDVVYKTLGERQLHLDICRPTKSGKYPAVIMIHGGGWRSGNKSMERPMAQQLALQGFVAVPVEYRLSLEAKFPAAVYDIKAAIRFLKDHAEMYQIDTTRIAIEGESAGGHLAMLVAMSGADKLEGEKNGSHSSSAVHAVIDVDGIVSFLMPGSLNTERKPDSPDVFWLGGTFTDVPQVWKEASPLFYAGKNSVPALFICSAQPRFHAGRDEMRDILQQNGIYSESYTIPDTPHSFWLFHPWFDTTKEKMVKFLKKVF